jgi:hypothetical protein
MVADQIETTASKCPYCNCDNPIPDVAYYNAEAYGGKVYRVCCVKCGGAIAASLTRVVKCTDIYATKFETSDWGERPKKNSDNLGRMNE